MWREETAEAVDTIGIVSTRICGLLFFDLSEGEPMAGGIFFRNLGGSKIALSKGESLRAVARQADGLPLKKMRRGEADNFSEIVNFLVYPES